MSNTTQTLSIVGAIVGAYLTGGTSFAAYGGFIGGAVGGAVGAALEDGTTTSGPRLDDRKVQVSTYGASIPYLFGGGRVAGNVIWAADLEEVQSENEQGGKGSGPTATQITYTYFGTFAVLLGYGKLRGIRRIFADAVLIFDGSLDPPVGDVDYTFYNGDEEQLPDPTMEAALGAGNVPAYRGFGYIVFNRLPLEKFGNRLPSITVELLGDGEWEGVGTALGETPPLLNLSGGVYWGSLVMGAAQRTDGQVVYMTYPNSTGPGTSTGVQLTLIDQFTGLPLLQVTHASVVASNEVVDANLLCYVPAIDELWLSVTGAVINRYSATTLQLVGTIGLFGGAAKLTWEPRTRRVYFRPNAAWICAGGSNVVLGAGIFNVDVLRLYNVTPNDGDPLNTDNGKLTDAGTIDLEGSINYETMDAIITALPLSLGTDGSAQSAGACYDLTRRRYVVITQRIWTVTDELVPVMTVVDWPVGTHIGSLGSVRFDSATDTIVIVSGMIGDVGLTVLDAETFELLYQSASPSIDGDGTLGATFGFPSLQGSMLIVGAYQPWQLDYFGTTVGATVQRLAIESGLTSGDLNVSELGIPLRGYIVAQAGPAVGAIQQLAQIFLFEGVEEDDKLYFRRRGGASVATISKDECAAGVDKAADIAIAITRTQEIELPRRLTVTAPDPATDYQPGTQPGERRAIEAGQVEGVSTAVVLTVTDCKRTADALIFDRWAQRERLTWTNSLARLALSPTDPVTLDGRRVRILRRSVSAGVISFEGVSDDAHVIEQSSTGAQGAFPGQTPSIQVPTVMVIVDTALLDDAQNEAGAYVAAYGVAPYWRGGLIYYSTDGGIGWTRLATMPRPGSALGFTTDALGDWTGGNVFDEVNSVNVTISNGTLSSTTRAGVLAGNNPIAINGTDGWEVLQYRTATLEVDGSYTLTGLLRGRRGTEFAMGGHAAGDRAVPLSSFNIRDLPIANPQIGVTLPFRAVSVGDTLSATPSVTTAITAERLKPFSPVDFRALRDVGTGDITMQWRRRTRLSYRFLAPGIDAPLGEETEAYTVQVYDSSYTTLKRTFTPSASSQVYTSAQQTTDFGSNQSTVYVRITQTSATVGAGHELEAAA